MNQSDRWLLISDLQIPYEAPKALEFVKYVQKHFKIPHENVYCVGDEIDNLHGSLYPKDPNVEFSPRGEIRQAKEKLKQWASEFPRLKIAISNHEQRWLKKATASEIPSEIIRSTREIFELPETWHWQDRWLVRAKHPFIVLHGVEFGGKTPYRQACELLGHSVAFGHLHSSAGISYVNTSSSKQPGGYRVWGFNTGSLIDIDADAFRYGRHNKYKPNLGIGVVLDDGKMPVWVPYD